MTIAALEEAHRLSIDSMRWGNCPPHNWAWRRSVARKTGIAKEYALPGGGYVQVRFDRRGRLLGYHFSPASPAKWWV